MSKKILVIPFDRLEEENIPINDVSKTSLMALKKLAVADWNTDQLVEYINQSVEFRSIDEETHLFYTYEVSEDEIELSECESHEVVVNKKVQLHIVRADVGFIVDVYKYATEEEMEKDDYDFDSDFVKSLQILDDELEDEDEE